MNNQTSTLHEPGCACKDCASSTRNRFFRGKTMKAAEFQIEQTYGIERRRLLTRAIAGWGVVHGLAIDGARQNPNPNPSSTSESGTLKVLRGLALDRQGREAVVVTSTTIGVNNTFLIETGAGSCQVKSIKTIQPGQYVLAIHYAERPLGEAALPDDCECTKPEKNFLCETVLFSLARMCDDQCPCGEPKCARQCRCRGEGSCPHDGRGPHACLCQWTAAVPDGPAPTCQWEGYAVDPRDGIDLACVFISEAGDACSQAVNGWVIDDCSPRRILKNNDLLYDLIRGCDLTRIESLSWGDWHRREGAVPWDEFVARLKAGTSGDTDHETGLSVTFTGPVKTATVTPDCFAFMFMVEDEDTGWFKWLTVPVTRVLKLPPHTGDPSDTTRKATLCVGADWYEEVMSTASKFKKEGATVRLEINGDFILDCHGQAIDANARGFALRDPRNGSAVAPSGNGTPGGTLVSLFRIERRPAVPKTP